MPRVGVLPSDRQDAAFDGVDGIPPAALDVEVRGRDGLHAGREGVGGPAAERAAGPVDLPRGQTEVAGDVDRAAPARGSHRDDLPGLLGQDRDDGDRVDADGDRVAEQAERNGREDWARGFLGLG